MRYFLILSIFIISACTSSLKPFEETALKTAIFKEEANRECGDNFTCNMVLKNITVENGSIYKSSIKMGVPDSVTINMLRLYWSDFNLKTQVKNGDKITILYQEYYDKNSKKIRANSLIYASLSIDGKPVPIYRHNLSENQTDYYYADGKLVSRDPLPKFNKIVVKHARLSSPFGLRTHPVLRRKTLHKGADLATPHGYRIYAPANGVITFRGRKRGYGYYIRLKHNNKYSTAYAHLSRYHGRVRRGAKIKKGQVIGYVGRSGRVTGTHLHYEIIRNSLRIDPLSKIISPPENLELQDFERLNDNIDYIQKIIYQSKSSEESNLPLKGENDD